MSPPRIRNMRDAQIIAEAVAVICPYCAATQPNKDGSEMWTAEDFLTGFNIHKCVSCDEVMRLVFQSRVSFSR